MRNFDYITNPAKLLTPEIVQMVGSIHEHKGKQELFLEANIDELKTLLEVALIQSTGASNRIEGIFTSDKRLEELVSQKAEPRNRSEQEIAGYREVLATIHESYEYITPRPNIILQLHRDLYSYSQGNIGGTYKNSDNVIAETDAEGHQKARFIPVPAFQTAEAIDELCARFLEAWEADRIDKLVLIPMFILDFLCIHPFNDGNGRMSRLLTLLLFYKAGYIVGKYVSMEMLIEKTKETYYEALQASSTGWHEGENSYEPVSYTHLDVYKRQGIDKVWNIHDVDPEGKGEVNLEINFDKECFMYYQAFVSYVDSLNQVYQCESVKNQKYYCWVYEDEKYCILEEIYNSMKSGQFNEQNRYRNFNNYVNEKLSDIEYPEQFSHDGISSYEDGIVVCSSVSWRDKLH